MFVRTVNSSNSVVASLFVDETRFVSNLNYYSLANAEFSYKEE